VFLLLVGKLGEFKKKRRLGDERQGFEWVIKLCLGRKNQVVIIGADIVVGTGKKV